MEYEFTFAMTISAPILDSVTSSVGVKALHVFELVQPDVSATWNDPDMVLRCELVRDSDAVL